MLTGPVTILNGRSSVTTSRGEISCRQIALAIRDEVTDLEFAGCTAIQIDEPALREGLPLRRGQWQHYLDWAVDCFRLAASGVADATQIHTHMHRVRLESAEQVDSELKAWLQRAYDSAG